MATKWEFETMTGFDDRTMEETLTEVFGCTPLGSRIINLDLSRDKRRVKKDFLFYGNTMEEMLIDIFGCISHNAPETRVIDIAAGRGIIAESVDIAADAVARSA